MRILTETLAPNNARLTVYLPEPSQEMTNLAPRPLVLVLPGGGYFMTSDREAEPIALAYLTRGYATAILRYSVGKDATFDQALADAQAGFGWLQEQAAELAIDPAKIAVIGFSAGGHLAAALGTLAPAKPAALILGYPVITAGLNELLGKPLPDLAARVTAATPPTFIFSTADDPVVPINHSLSFAQALDAAKVPFELHIYRHGAHGLSLAQSQTSSGRLDMVEAAVAEWVAASLRFLTETWGDFPVDATPVVLPDSPVLALTWAEFSANPAAMAVLAERAPELFGILQANNDMIQSLTLAALAERADQLRDPEFLAVLETALAE